MNKRGPSVERRLYEELLSELKQPYGFGSVAARGFDIAKVYIQAKESRVAVQDVLKSSGSGIPVRSIPVGIGQAGRGQGANAQAGESGQKSAASLLTRQQLEASFTNHDWARRASLLHRRSDAFGANDYCQRFT